jgi:SET domain-containing protein
MTKVEKYLQDGYIDITDPCTSDGTVLIKINKNLEDVHIVFIDEENDDREMFLFTSEIEKLVGLVKEAKCKSH